MRVAVEHRPAVAGARGHIGVRDPCSCSHGRWDDRVGVRCHDRPSGCDGPRLRRQSERSFAVEFLYTPRCAFYLATRLGACKAHHEAGCPGPLLTRSGWQRRPSSYFVTSSA